MPTDASSQLTTGAELRLTGPAAPSAGVVCVNGGQSHEAAGTWSATLEWLVRRIAPAFPGLTFAEVRYRVKSWNKLDWCIEDARAAVSAVGAPRTLLLGFSMGGAVAVSVADEPSVEPLRGRRLRILHGSLDRPFLGIPGVSPAASRRGFDRAQALGVDGDYTLIPGAGHAIALRAHRGRALPLPRAGAWARLVADELRRFQEPD